MLLQQGADTMYSDIYGRTVLHYACILGVEKSILQLLIDFNEKLTEEDMHTEEVN